MNEKQKQTLELMREEGARISTTKLVQKSYGRAKVYDVSVKDGHTFIGNNLVNHNTCNFSNLYGGSPQALADAAGISLSDAKVIWQGWWDGLSKIKLWKSRQEKFAETNGFVKTFFGRKIMLADAQLQVPKFGRNPEEKKLISKKNAAFRQSINYPVQGCCRYNTRVITNRGYLKIGELYDGIVKAETIWDGEGWRTFDVVNRGPAKLAEIELKDGRILECDERHEIFTHTVGNTSKSKITHIQDLKPGMLVCTPKRGVSIEFEREFEPFTWEKPQTVHRVSIENKDQLELAWYWAGYIMGDGYLFEGQSRQEAVKGQYLSIAFGYHEESKASELELWLASFGLTSHRNDTKTSIGRSFQVRCSSPAIIELFLWLGMVPNATSKTKRVPDRLFTETARNRQAFVQGLWDSDGAKPSRNLHLMNLPLLQDVHLLYDTLGYNGKVSKLYKDGSSQLTFRHTKNGTSKFYDPRYGRGTVREVRFFEEVEETYTLAVHHENHRYFSNGILSKNTAADIMKIAMSNVHAYIKSRKLENDVRMLLTVHDEIVYEIRDDLLPEVIPEIVKLMCFEIPGFQVPLTCDIELSKDWGSVLEYKKHYENLGLNISTPDEDKIMREPEIKRNINSISDTRLSVAEQFKIAVPLNPAALSGDDLETFATQVTRLSQIHPGSTQVVLEFSNQKRVLLPRKVDKRGFLSAVQALIETTNG